MHLSGRSDAEIFVALAYAAIAAVNTMPEPGTKIDWYAWFWRWTHVLLNSPIAQRLEQKTETKQPGA